MMTSTKHRHVAVSESQPQPFRGPVSQRENRMAHGGIRVVETCCCGHIRSVNRNQHHEERGAWVPRD